MEKQAPEGEDRGYFEGPGGNPGESAPGQSKSPSVRRARRDDFELYSGRKERDRAYVHDSQNRTAGLGYASSRGQGPLHHRAPSRQRGNESHDYSRDRI